MHHPDAAADACYIFMSVNPLSHLPLIPLSMSIRALSHMDSGAKTWIQAGNLFVKTRNETAKKLISRGELPKPAAFFNGTRTKNTVENMHTGSHFHVNITASERRDEFAVKVYNVSKKEVGRRE